MKAKEIKKAINKLGPWYQRYEMDGYYTTEDKISGDIVWPDIRGLMADDLYRARILDLGANACYYTMMLALEGAEVIAVEPTPRYFKQGQWTKYYFEKKYNMKFPVTLLKKSASELDFIDLDSFDYILVLSTLYFIGKEYGGSYSPGALEEQKRVISEMCKVTDKIIVRTRNNKLYNSIPYYNSIFLENEFFMLKKIIKKRPIMLYGRLERHSDYGLQY